MIRSFADGATRRFFERGKASNYRGLDAGSAEELLALLDAASSLADLGGLASTGLHKLKGDRKGQWAMTVNGRWRLCFAFRDGDAHDVQIVDYHRG